MQQISVNNLPKIGYYVSNEDKKEKFNQSETHIHKQGPLSGVKAGAHKLYNDIFTYFPKGFAGSKNSDFYEFLSLGMVPYIIGSVMLVALYGAAIGKPNKASNNFCLNAAKNLKKNYNWTDDALPVKILNKIGKSKTNFNRADGGFALKNAKRMGAGVILYGIGKWAHQKLSHSLINASTGVNLDWLYLNKIAEMPEPGQEKGMSRTQYPGVFSSVDFYRRDLIAKDSELNHGNVYAYDDKIAKKAGFKNGLNAPNQTMGPKIRELKARTTASENIGKYIVAACGVALGAQKAFTNITYNRLTEKGSLKENLVNIKNAIKNHDTKNLKYAPLISKESANAFFISNPKNWASTIKNASLQLWRGSNRNIFTKYGGKAMVLASLAATMFTWLIPTIGYKTNPNTMKDKVDTKKEYEVC